MIDEGTENEGRRVKEKILSESEGNCVIDQIA